MLSIIGGSAMGAVEHLKTLCCLGLPPESAMISLTPLLHEIIPHGWTRFVLLETDTTATGGYCENPAAPALLRERVWRLMDDPAGPGPIWRATYRAGGIGWSLPLQSQSKWLESSWYHEIEAPLDSCWFLSAMIRDGVCTIANLFLTRPRSARRFTGEDVRRIETLRPWLAHALRPRLGNLAYDVVGTAGTPLISGQLILTGDGKVVLQTTTMEHLFWIITRKFGNFAKHMSATDQIPAQVTKLRQRIVGAGSGCSGEPPRMQIWTAYGVVTLEAKWLMPANTIPTDVAKDPKSSLISVTIELREHALAQAARVLRARGATPAQTKVGIELALGKPKPAIAKTLGVAPSSVASLARKLYQTLEIHNSTELATKIWLNPQTVEAQRFARCSTPTESRIVREGANLHLYS
jgi:DNA-binding CsgD family transcriptional regulator